MKTISSVKSAQQVDWRRQLLIVVFATAGFFLFSLVMLDYYQNCAPTDCLAVHSALGFFHSLAFAAIFPVINLFPIPLTLRLFVPSLALFSLMLTSFFGLKFKTRGLPSAFADTLELALSMVILFEAGLYFLDPYWWLIHFSNLNSFPFSSITNQEIAATSAVSFSAIVCFRYTMKHAVKRIARW